MATKPASRKFLGWLSGSLILVGAGAVWYALDPGFRAENPRASISGDISQAAFDQRVRRFLLENPEVIIEAMGRLETRQRAAEAGEVASVLKARADELLRNPAHPEAGNPNGDVSLVEFFDYNCPYCRRVVPAMREAEAADPNLRIVYVEFPILGANSMFAAKAALAVHRQGKYLPFHMALMESRAVIDEARVIAVAGKVGVDVGRMKSDINDPAIGETIGKNLALAQALRINGTPSFVVGDQIIRGAVDLTTLQTFIRQARDRSN
jgi:protein-disulfide isomerase